MYASTYHDPPYEEGLGVSSEKGGFDILFRFSAHTKDAKSADFAPLCRLCPSLQTFAYLCRSLHPLCKCSVPLCRSLHPVCSYQNCQQIRWFHRGWPLRYFNNKRCITFQWRDPQRIEGATLECMHRHTMTILTRRVVVCPP